jgi:hypothetical protein
MGRSERRLYGTGAAVVLTREANPGVVRGGLAADRQAPHDSAFPFSEILKNGLLHKNNSYKERKILEKSWG